MSDAEQTLAEDEALLIEAVRAAGDLAMSFFGREVSATQKADNSPVSEADLAVDRMLHDRLLRDRPSYGWLSEESADQPERLKAARVWIVDPIDGTRAFLANTLDWTISAALVEDEKPVLGAVFNPAKSEFFLARRSRGASLNGERIAVSARDAIEGSRLFTNKRFLKRDIWNEPWPPVDTFWVNSIAYRLALIAAGQADATVALSGTSEWDLAAAALLVQEAGGRITDAKGADLRFNQPMQRISGLVAAGPDLHALLVARTRPVAANDS